MPTIARRRTSVVGLCPCSSIERTAERIWHRRCDNNHHQKLAPGEADTKTETKPCQIIQQGREGGLGRRGDGNRHLRSIPGTMRKNDLTAHAAISRSAKTILGCVKPGVGWEGGITGVAWAINRGGLGKPVGGREWVPVYILGKPFLGLSPLGPRRWGLAGGGGRQAPAAPTLSSPHRRLRQHQGRIGQAPRATEPPHTHPRRWSNNQGRIGLVQTSFYPTVSADQAPTCAGKPRANRENRSSATEPPAGLGDRLAPHTKREFI